MNLYTYNICIVFISLRIYNRCITIQNKTVEFHKRNKLYRKIIHT